MVWTETIGRRRRRTSRPGARPTRTPRVIDSQSVKTTQGGGPRGRLHDVEHLGMTGEYEAFK